MVLNWQAWPSLVRQWAQHVTRAIATQNVLVALKNETPTYGAASRGLFCTGSTCGFPDSWILIVAAFRSKMVWGP